jgi:SAM-dependent methyltransferase
MMDPKEIVRVGYEQAADAYLAARPQDSPDIRALDRLMEQLPSGARVLDAGCGAGLPILRRLAQRYQAVGVDFAARQTALAAGNVPAAATARMDLTRLAFAAESFDAIVSYYAIIHIARTEHTGILAGFYRLLRPGGLAFLCLGAMDIDDDYDDDFYGARMYWSHYDAPTNLKLLRQAGFEMLWSEVIGDSLGGEAATGGHLFVLARKPAGATIE